MGITQAYAQGPRGLLAGASWLGEAIEAGERWPDWTTYDRIAAAFGWARSFR